MQCVLVLRGPLLVVPGFQLLAVEVLLENILKPVVVLVQQIGVKVGQDERSPEISCGSCGCEDSRIRFRAELDLRNIIQLVQVLVRIQMQGMVDHPVPRLRVLNEVWRMPA